MDASLYKSVQRLLSSRKINVADDYIAEKLMRHPDYPSAWCVSEVLNELGLDSVVVKIEKHLLDQVPLPVLAHVRTNGGEFVLIDSLKKLRKLRKNFEEVWDGILLGVEAPEGWSYVGFDSSLETEKRDTLFRQYGIFIFSVLTAAYCLLDFSWISFFAFLSTSFGLIFAWSGVCNELGIGNKVSEQFCGSLTTCKSQLNDNPKRILGVSFSDLAMTWFLISFCILAILKITPLAGLSCLLFVVSSFALFFIPISLYLQWQVKKEWCPICLAIAGCVTGQFFVLLIDFKPNDFLWIKINDMAFFALICLAIVFAWNSYRSNKEMQLRESVEKNHAYKLYFDNDVFNSLLEKSSRIDVTPWENEIQLGNQDAALQITVVSNPFCGPCAQAHNQLDKLLEVHDFGLQVRFVLNANDASDERTKVVRQILQYLIPHQEEKEYCRVVLNTWFSNAKLDLFGRDYPDRSDVEVYPTLAQHEAWAVHAKIKRTPTILINGYPYPDIYRVEDLRELIPLIIRNK